MFELARSPKNHANRTKDAILVIEAINDEQAKRAQTAMQELKDLAKEYFGVEGTIYQLNAQQASLEV